jgi:hypothetical protein
MQLRAPLIRFKIRRYFRKVSTCRKCGRITDRELTSHKNKMGNAGCWYYICPCGKFAAFDDYIRIVNSNSCCKCGRRSRLERTVTLYIVTVDFDTGLLVLLGRVLTGPWADGDTIVTKQPASDSCSTSSNYSALTCTRGKRVV